MPATLLDTKTVNVATVVATAITGVIQNIKYWNANTGLFEASPPANIPFGGYIGCTAEMKNTGSGSQGMYLKFTLKRPNGSVKSTIDWSATPYTLAPGVTQLNGWSDFSDIAGVWTEVIELYGVGALLLDIKTVNVATVLAPVLPDVPVLVSPADLATEVPIPSPLAWGAVPNAAWYRVQVAKDSAFSQMVADIPDVAALTLNVSGLSPATAHYWRVNATGPAGSSDWSSTWSFTTTSAAAVSPIESMMPMMVMVMMFGMVSGMVPKEGM